MSIIAITDRLASSAPMISAGHKLIEKVMMMMISPQETLAQ